MENYSVTTPKKKNDMVVPVILITIIVILGAFAAAYFFFRNNDTSLSSDKADSIIRAHWEENKYEDDAEPVPFMTVIDRRSSFEFISMDYADGVYTVLYNVTAPDAAGAILEYFEQNSTVYVDDADALFAEIAENSKLVTAEAEVYLQETDGEYSVVYSSEFTDYMSGRIESAFYSFVENNS